MNDTSHPTILSQATIDRILPARVEIVAEIEARYPDRNLPAGAQVTRVAPSPTGFMHVGVVYASLISERLAHLSDGVFFLRIEDTDRKREVEGAKDFIVESLGAYGIHTDEGALEHDSERGAYGPYTQSLREPIYKAYIHKLLQEGKAYPCFMTPEELTAMTETQNRQKARPGYYGPWAAWRDRPEADVTAALDAGKPFVIRFRNTGDISKKLVVHDKVRGNMEMPQSDNDIVILKQDGLPTYHLAHAIDDHLMHTTLVTRGDEWLPSTTLHMQLSEALGHPPFTYAHIAPLQKTEGSSRRKLSKRKDPEASMTFYAERGYLPKTLIEYLLNQANSSFEAWRRENPAKPYTEFPLSTDHLSKSGALFSLEKLDSIGADHIAALTADELSGLLADWAKKYAPEFYDALARDPAYTKAVLGIERDGTQPRKDMKHLSEAPDLYGYFFDDIFGQLTTDEFVKEKMARITPEDRKAIIDEFLATYDPADTNEQWFEKVKAVGEPLGFTPVAKEYRKHPELYKGSVADVAMVLRVALTKRNQSPSLHELMRAMGRERVEKRLHEFVG